MRSLAGGHSASDLLSVVLESVHAVGCGLLPLTDLTKVSGLWRRPCDPLLCHLSTRPRCRFCWVPCTSRHSRRSPPLPTSCEEFIRPCARSCANRSRSSDPGLSVVDSSLQNRGRFSSYIGHRVTLIVRIQSFVRPESTHSRGCNVTRSELELPASPSPVPQVVGEGLSAVEKIVIRSNACVLLFLILHSIADIHASRLRCRSLFLSNTAPWR